MASGCFNAGVPVRSGELPGAGNFCGHAQLPLVTYAPGEIVASDGSRTDQTFGERVHLLDAAYIIVVPGLVLVLNGMFGFEVGLTDWLSLDFTLGLQQLGGDVRLALLDEEDEGAPISLALSAGAAYRPFIEAESPWLLAGLDLSRRWTSVLAIANVYASYGPESHVDHLSAEQRSRFPADDPGDEGVSRYFAMTRDEMCVHLTLGVGPASRQADLEYAYLFSLVGYATLRTEPPDFMDCYSCDALEPFTFEEDVGVSLVLSAAMRGLD